MRAYVPSDLTDWALLIVGVALGYWMVGNRRAHGSAVPGTTLLASNTSGQSGLG